MFPSMRLLRRLAMELASVAFFGFPQVSIAQLGFPGGGFGGPQGNTSSLANQTGFNTQGVVRSTNVLANPMNFFQYGQTTGVGPIRGTIRIYNIFGTFAMQSGMGGGGGGGFGGFGGGGGGNFLGTNTGAGGFGTNLPGSGATQGDDGPQGTLLHVNYANMFFPNQQQLDLSNNAGAGGGGGGFGGFPGFGGGFPGFGGKGTFGNGGSGL